MALTHPDATLTEAEAESLQQQLREERDSLKARLAAMSEELSQRTDCSTLDAADAAGVRERQRRAAAVAFSLEKTLAAVDAALGRMEAGQYGVSLASGRPISLARLRLVPWAGTTADE